MNEGPGHVPMHMIQENMRIQTNVIDAAYRHGVKKLLFLGSSCIYPKFAQQPIKEDICYATTNRQTAVKEIASKCDIFFVVGSRNSSNSVRLVEVAKKAGCNNSQLMHSEKEIPYNEIDSSDTIGISSGASAPDKLVQTLLNNIKKDRKVSIEEVVVAEEKVVFKLPKELG